MRLFVSVLLFWLCSPVAEAVNPHNCVYIGSSIDYSLRKALSDQHGFDNQNVDLKDSNIELLENLPVSEVMAKALAQADVVKFKHLDYAERLKHYTKYNARSLLLKYIYINKQGKINRYIVSAIVNDEMCWLHFNGYLTLS
ncbi:hypothetical protein [Pantoea sp.]|uniref:hypothetical protein n=1 Tax=Pantoea sp. TaxID=69393 RepID=UPI0028A09BEE|nr:hypothetical protein [Pantoea sp.]